jgi:hypothetical protein
MKNFLVLCIFSSIYVYGGAIFTPSNPVVYPGSSVANPGVPIVQATVNGFMVIWQDSVTKNLVTSISKDQGTTWSPLEIVGPAIPGYLGWVSGNSSGFISGGAEWRADQRNLTYFTSVYTPTTPTWSSPYNVGGQTQNYIDGTRGISLAASEKAFLSAFSWTDQDSPTFIQNIYANVSLDGVHWFDEPVFVGMTYNEYLLPVFPSACAKGDIFLITWLDNQSNEAKVSISSDSGSTWSTPITAAVPGPTLNSSTQIGCFASDEGFMLAYRDDEALYASFSVDGEKWTTTQVTKHVTQEVADYIPIISGNSCGFVIAWVGTVSLGTREKVFVSISENQGKTWSNPIDVSQDEFPTSYLLSNVSISTHNDQCILGWTNTAGKAVLCHATLTAAPH